jgi:hypothetical protein
VNSPKSLKVPRVSTLRGKFPPSSAADTKRFPVMAALR